jgi:beta-phosphoglucomutase-like phosphatase (HAD superfamily)
MTSATPAASDLDAILTRTRHLLLDFDGPICSIFAGLPAATVAGRLRKLLGDHPQMPGDIASTPDPFAVFAYAATVSEDLAAQVETEMTDLELAAVATAAPTRYVHEVVTACQDSGRTVAVVSNNSARAVHSYLARHGLADRISLVVARTDHDPALLKPSPHLITWAVVSLDAGPGECTLVGDSVTDIQGARLAGVQSIGYVNKPGKRERFTAAGAGAIINSLADLALRLRARAANPELLQLSLRFQGCAFGTPRAGPVARTQAVDARSSSRDALTETGTTARTKRRSWRGCCPTPGRRPCRAPSGGSPAGRAAAARPGCPASAGRRSPP